MANMKRLEFLGDSLEQLREFPEAARKEAGVQLHKVQQDIEPSDWKPMTSVGRGGAGNSYPRRGWSLSSALHRQDRRCRLCAARLSEEDAADG